jgi:hypothetical protein
MTSPSYQKFLDEADGKIRGPHEGWILTKCAKCDLEDGPHYLIRPCDRDKETVYCEMHHEYPYREFLRAATQSLKSHRRRTISDAPKRSRRSAGAILLALSLLGAEPFVQSYEG